MGGGGEKYFTFSHILKSFFFLWIAGTHRLIFGRAIPVIGNKWVLSFPLGEIGFTPTLYPDSSKVDDILDALNQDADFLPPDNFQYGASDPYFAGKMLQRMAINAIIAEDLGEIVTAKKIAKALDPFVRVWLEHRTANPLLYDKSWGGIISCGCSYDHGASKVFGLLAKLFQTYTLLFWGEVILKYLS